MSAIIKPILSIAGAAASLIPGVGPIIGSALGGLGGIFGGGGSSMGAPPSSGPGGPGHTAVSRAPASPFGGGLFSSAMDLGTGVFDYFKQKELADRYEGIAERQDPFGQGNRNFFQQQLVGMNTPGFDVNSIPGYSAAKADMNKEIGRAAAARGQNFSGDVIDDISSATGDLAMSAYTAQQQFAGTAGGMQFRPEGGEYDAMAAQADYGAGSSLVKSAQEIAKRYGVR